MPSPSFEQRPWGRFWVLSDAADCKVKRLEVDPGQRLSYQRHAKRREHWLVVAGVATITLDDVEHTRGIGEAIDVPQRAWHRLANRGSEVLAVVEVQLGEYFGEDDIERRSDDYGRADG
jgi:mannose-6-phosphate isomerase-like protein (cupin superfamily)